MAQVRYKRDGTRTVANTVYIKEHIDKQLADVAKRRKKLTKKCWSKSAVIVETVEKHAPTE